MPEPYALAAPALVDVTAIERELEALWRAAAKNENSADAVLRAASFNLVYATSAAQHEQDMSEIVAELTTAHPSRAILLQLVDKPILERAWVTAYCSRPTGSAQQICSEFITLEASATDCDAVISTLLALRLSGLPTALIWDASLAADHPLLIKFGRQCERVITQLFRPCAPAVELNTFFKLQSNLGSKTIVTDLLESSLPPWQEKIAALFDQHPECATHIHTITIHHEGQRLPAEMLLLAAWLVESLRESPAKPKLVFTNNAPAALIDFRLDSASDHLGCEEPVYENRLTVLLANELRIWSCDTVRAAWLKRAEHMRKEFMRELVICETPADVADAAADLIFQQQTAAISERGVFRMALSGGKTPALLFDLLASAEWKTAMQWESWEVFWSDERALPPDHKESNYRLAKKWLDKVPIAEVWRMPGEAGDLQQAALDYARTIKMQFGTALPVFDTILLGLGTDGHTASLFPHHAALKSPAVVEAVEVDQPIPRRLTLTLPVLNAARQIIFLITGAEKAVTVQTIFENEYSDLPAASVQPLDGECWWILDEAAASEIR